MGRRRHRRRRAEGPDDAARHVVQRRQRQGARGRQDVQVAEVVLGLGRHAEHEQDRLLPLHAGDAACCRASPSASTCCTRKASTTCSPATTASAEATRRAVRAWGLEIMCRDPKYYSPTITAVMLPDGHNADAFRSARARTASTSPMARASARFRRQVFPHRPSRRHQRRHADRRAGRDRDGAGACRRAAQEGRRAGGDGLSDLRARKPDPGRRGVDSVLAPLAGRGRGSITAAESSPPSPMPPSHSRRRRRTL